MEPGGAVPTAPALRASPEGRGDGPGTDPGKLRALPVWPGAHRAAPAPRSPAGEQSCTVQAPDRDSGTDSPPCSMPTGPFCQDGGEAGGPTLLAPHPKAAPGSLTTREEAHSAVGQGGSEEPAPERSPPGAGVHLAERSRSQELLHIAQELLHTEETYVRRLHLLDQVFCAQLTAAGVPPEVTTGVFSNISSIYRFHWQFLLPALRTRITEEWDGNPRFGDILQKLAPFLKMYGEYVKNFDRAVELVGAWTQRSALFRDVVHSIQKQEACGSLTLQHHMLEPVQRVPRYELLLKDYLKRLPADAPDRQDTEKSLELISTAASHSNAAIRKMEKMHQLLEVYEQLGGEEAVVNPATELVKEGPIQKLSAKTGAAQDRHLFLFNSSVLYCVPRPRLLGPKFSVREKMDISDLQVQDTSQPPAAPTFTLTGRSRALELRARTEEEKKEWIQVIEATISKHRQNSQTFKAFGTAVGPDGDRSWTPEPPTTSTSSEEPAAAAGSGGGAAGVSDSQQRQELEPRRGSSKTRRDKEKQSCKGCGETFNSITKRRHHCKLCGAVICGKCSEFKAESGRQSRVCGECFLTQPVAPVSSSPGGPAEPQKTVEDHRDWRRPGGEICCGPNPLRALLRCHAPRLPFKGRPQGQWAITHPAPAGCTVRAGPAETLRPAPDCVAGLRPSVPASELQLRWLRALSVVAMGPGRASPGPKPRPGDRKLSLGRGPCSEASTAGPVLA